MSLFDLSGRVAIVTGGNGGIGLGMAEGIAAAGATVVLAGAQRRRRARPRSKQIKDAGGKAEFAEVDVANDELLPGADRRRGRSVTAASTS